MDFGTLRVTYLGNARPVVDAARTVDRINAQTARNAERNDRLVERSAKQLADVRAREAKRAANDFIKELERMRRAERQSSGGSGGGYGTQLSALTGGRFGFVGGGAAAGIGALAVGFGAAAKAGIEYDQTIDRLTRSFESLLGSSQAAAAHLEDLRRFAAATPFEFEDVARASQRFQNMGLKAADVIPTLRAVGNAVSAAGGGSEEINRVSLALSQMAAKGKVSAEEMNQLAEAGVGGWKLLEQQTGKTKAELFKMAEAGKLSADAFLEAFRAAYGSGNQMQRQMETLAGATSTLKDAGKELLGQAFRPLHDTLRDIAVELAKMTSEGWNSERALKAAGAAARDWINSANSPWFDKWLIFFAAQQGLGGAAAGALGYGPKPQASWGTPNAGWGQIEVPDEFKYRPKISDEDLAKVTNAASRAEKEKYVTDILKKQEEARRKAQQEAEKAAREAEAALKRQQAALQDLADEYASLKIKADLFNQSEVEQQIALMRLKNGTDALTDSAQGLLNLYIAGSKLPKGLLEPGNIDLTKRPRVKNPDGSISTVRSFSTNIDGREVLLPTVGDEGRIISEEEAIKRFRESGKHLGMFRTPDDATAYAIALHKQQEAAAGLTSAYRGQKETLVDLIATQMRLIAAKEAEKQQTEATEEAYRQSRAMRLELLGIERTHTDAVNEFVLASVEQGAQLDKRQTQLLYVAAAGRDAAESLERLAETSDLFKVPDFKLPEGPVVDPREVGPAPPNVFEDIARRRREMVEVGEDLANIFINVFASIEDGWQGMWREMLNVARNTLLDISRELLRTALTGQKSGAGGLIGLAANWIGGALFGSVGGGTLPGGGHGGAVVGAGGKVGGFASGTSYAPPGLAWVGERGPELMAFRGGERVFNARESARMGAVVNNVTNIYYQPKVTPNSVTSRRSQRENFEALLSLAR